MKRGLALLSILALTVTGIGAADAPDVLAQTPPSGVIPGPPPGEAHPPIHVHGQPQASPSGFTPSQIAVAYGFSQLSCVNTSNHFDTSKKNDCGNGQTIAIVDAFDDPNAASDLTTFNAQFGLPACTKSNGCFSQVNAQNGRTRGDPSWALEAALDIEWAHAMAPGAKILLV
jgi:subtilase family serine protease